MAWSEWYETDSDCCQYMRNDGQKYEIIQSVWLDTTKKDKDNGLHEYIVVNDEIDLNELNDEDVLGAISSYGYNIISFINSYGDAVNNIIAECYLADHSLCDGNTIGAFHNFDDAKAYIEDYISKEKRI